MPAMVTTQPATVVSPSVSANDPFGFSTSPAKPVYGSNGTSAANLMGQTEFNPFGASQSAHVSTQQPAKPADFNPFF
jgi:hypothetical protein